MRGRIFDIDRQNRKAKVDTRNDKYGTLTVYFNNHDIPQDVCENCTIEFDVKISRLNNYYAVFSGIVERNPAIFNTEDRERWYNRGEKLEGDFLLECVSIIGRDIRRNPIKDTDPTAIDMLDYSDNPLGTPCDLKTQNTPFFRAGRYAYRKGTRQIKYDPSYTVTFNRKDYEKYKREYPDCIIYFRVQWQQQTGYGVTVADVDGVWAAQFCEMSNRIESGAVPLHEYQNRRTDDHNAKESYLFDLNDETLFTKLM